MRPSTRRGRRGPVVLALLVTPLWLGACASLMPGASRPDHRSGPVERAEAPADYDVLVGSLAALEGRPDEARAAFERAAAKDPDSAYLERMLGRLAAQLDDLDGALVHAQRAVELDPEDPEARLFLGRLHRVRRDVAGAEAALLAADGSPLPGEAGLLLYQIYLDDQQLERALAVAETLVLHDPTWLPAHMAVATAYERLGRYDESEQSLRRALEFHPGRWVLYSRLAKVKRGAGDREGEIAVYREALALEPDHYGTLVSLAEAQIALGDSEGAIATYERLLGYYPEDLQSVRRIARLELDAGRKEQAAHRLEAALERHPEHPELAFVLGSVWDELDEEDAAIAAWERVEPASELYLDARLRIAGVYARREEFARALAEVERARAIETNRALEIYTAELRARAGDFEGGLALLEALRAEAPEDDEILYQIAVLHGLVKQVDEALALMREVLELNPENPHALNYIGYSLAERGESLDEAEQLIEKALELRPDDGYITDSLGWVYYMRARPLMGSGQVEDGRQLLERARDQLFQAAELTGGDPVVSEHLGDVFLLLGEKEQALHFYEEALSLEPRREEQPHLLEKLEALRRELQGR